jgi:hypothetical protein
VTTEIFAKFFLPRFSRFFVFHPIVKTFFHCKTQTHQISLKRHVIPSTSRARRLKCSTFFVVFFVAQLYESGAVFICDVTRTDAKSMGDDVLRND